MTYKEYVAEKDPSRINCDSFGGMIGCPGDDTSDDAVIKFAPSLGSKGRCGRSPGHSNCSVCWNTEIPENLIPEKKKDEPKIDIHKIIDDAMEKKDRTVSIYIGQSCVTINVTPYEPEEPARWIHIENDHHCSYRFECSACGAEHEFPSLYCPHCGEQMKMPKEEETDV